VDGESVIPLEYAENKVFLQHEIERYGNPHKNDHGYRQYAG
jgi:hypothetical protein